MIERLHEPGMKTAINEILQKTSIKEIHMLSVSMCREKCVTRETMMDFYQGRYNQTYKKSIGETIEKFMTLGPFSK